MKERAKRGAVLVLALGLALSLGACGGSNNKTDASSTAQSVTESHDSSYENAPGMEAGEGADVAGAEQPLAAAGRKLITTCRISAEAEDYDGAMDWLEEKLAEAGGYAESSEVYAYNGARRSCQMKLRVPADRLDGFLKAVEERWNILERSVQEDDVTLDYVDTESRKEALLVEQERLLELLSRAEKLEDILQIEDRLTQVRYQLEGYESALRVYDSQIDYSTVDLDLQEVGELTEPVPESWGSRALQGMKDNAKGLLRFFQELGLLIVTHLPVLGLLAVVAAVVLLCTRKPRRAARERRRLNKEVIAARQKEYMEGLRKESDKKSE